MSTIEDRSEMISRLFGKTLNHFVVMSNAGQVPLEMLLNTWVSLYQEAEVNVNKRQLDTVGNDEELAFALYNCIGIINSILAKTIDRVDSQQNQRILERTKEAQGSLAALEGQLATLCESIKEARMAHAMLVDQQAELARLQGEHSALIEDIDRLNKPELGKLDTLRAAVQSLTHEHSALLDNSQILIEEKAQAEERLAQETDNLRAMEQRLGELQHQSSALADSVERTKAEMTESENLLCALEEAMAALSPEASRQRLAHAQLCAEAVLQPWRALSEDPVYSGVMAKTESDTDKLLALHRALVDDINGFAQKAKELRDRYAVLLLEWERKGDEYGRNDI